LTKNKVIHFRVTEALKKEIEKIAVEGGFTVSEYFLKLHYDNNYIKVEKDDINIIIKEIVKNNN